MHTALGSHQNFLALGKEHASFDRAKVVVLPVPCQHTSGPGPRSGPAAILKASQGLGRFDEETGRDIAAEVGIATLTPVSAGALKEAALLTKLDSQVADLLSHDKFVVTLGGDHLLTSACVAAHAKRFGNLSVLHFDAHACLQASGKTRTYSESSAMTHVCEFLDPKRLVQAGIRSLSGEEAEFIKEQGLHTYFAHNIRSGAHTRLLKYWDDAVVDNLTDEVYVTIDVDVFEPSVMPATSTPAPNGLFWAEVLQSLRKVGQKRRIVGFEVVGLSPIKGLKYPEIAAAKLVSKLIAYAVS